MDKNVFYITEEGLQKLKERLEYLTKVERFKVAELIKAAREYGDLSENAEYQDAIERQSLLEAEISEIEDHIKNARIIDETKTKSKYVKVGSTVTILTEKKQEVTYQIVGKLEADPFKGMISNESPVGKALIGKCENDTVEYVAPSGKMKVKILSIK